MFHMFSARDQTHITESESKQSMGHASIHSYFVELAWE